MLGWCTLLGLAYGLAFASLSGLILGAVDQKQTGSATGINTILRTIGGARGSVLAAVIVTSSATAPGQPPAESGYTTTFVAAAIALCAAAVTATRGAVTAPTGTEPSTWNPAKAVDPKAGRQR
ncbi:hypothetical protein [Streptomyces sp. Agncl-13]|uniref:hypothetical protein n=1 Tax=Streptomyces sp. Agncl-13 TaxID=3400628 RepID=UPI003A8B0A7F